MGKIISFFGADHKCGTSMVSLSAAERIAAINKELRVILVHTEGGNGDDFTVHVSESLDSIRPYIEEKLLDLSGIECSVKLNNLFIIGGSKNAGTGFSFHPDMGEYYVKKLASEFDIVICDCGSEIEHGLCLGALFSSDVVYIVASQSEAAIRRYEYQKLLIRNLKIKVKKVLINKFSKRNINTLDMIANRFEIDMSQIFTIRASALGETAESERTGILDLKDKAFLKDIDRLAEEITKDCVYGKL